MPWVDQDEAAARSSAAHYLYPFVTLVLPSVLLTTAIFFARGRALAQPVRHLHPGHGAGDAVQHRGADHREHGEPARSRRCSIRSRSPSMADVTRYWTVAEQNSRVIPLAGDLLANRLFWTAVAIAIFAAHLRPVPLPEPGADARSQAEQGRADAGDDRDARSAHPGRVAIASTAARGGGCSSSQARLTFTGVVAIAAVPRARDRRHDQPRGRELVRRLLLRADRLAGDLHGGRDGEQCVPALLLHHRDDLLGRGHLAGAPAQAGPGHRRAAGADRHYGARKVRRARAGLCGVVAAADGCGRRDPDVQGVLHLRARALPALPLRHRAPDAAAAHGARVRGPRPGQPEVRGPRRDDRRVPVPAGPIHHRRRAPALPVRGGADVHLFGHEPVRAVRVQPGAGRALLVGRGPAPGRGRRGALGAGHAAALPRAAVPGAAALRRRHAADTPRWAAVLALAAGGAIFYNTNVLNPYQPTKAGRKKQATYEREYRELKDLPRPRLVAAKVRADLEPERGAFTASGTFTFVNKTAGPIDSVVITTSHPKIRLDTLAWDRPATAGAQRQRDGDPDPPFRSRARPAATPRAFATGPGGSSTDSGTTVPRRSWRTTAPS